MALPVSNLQGENTYRHTHTYTHLHTYRHTLWHTQQTINAVTHTHTRTHTHIHPYTHIHNRPKKHDRIVYPLEKSQETHRGVRKSTPIRMGKFQEEMCATTPRGSHTKVCVNGASAAVATRSAATIVSIMLKK